MTGCFVLSLLMLFGLSARHFSFVRGPGFVSVIKRLLSNADPTIRRKALDLLRLKIEHHKVRPRSS